MTIRPELHFHKMHGAGNDFVLLDLRQQAWQMNAADLGRFARRLADRRRGIGCDQLLFLHPAQQTGHAVRYEIRNPDGSQAGQCGNGARCIALYLDTIGEAGSGNLTLESPSGPVHVIRCTDGEYQVDMGRPAFDPGLVPISMNSDNGRYQLDSPVGT
ncbi:MAG: diaminopimelate epimerase, partial [Lysobacterales bacterium]